jgi:N-methylhydantoinase A
MAHLFIGIDTGGTFTDLVIFQKGKLTVHLEDQVAEAVERFHTAHQQRFGYSDSTKAVQVVNVRLKGRGRAAKPELARQEQLSTEEARAVSIHQVGFGSDGGRIAYHQTSVYQRAQLLAGTRLSGPALVLQYDTTTVIPPGWWGWIDEVGNLVLEQIASPGGGGWGILPR